MSKIREKARMKYRRENYICEKSLKLSRIIIYKC